MNARSCALRIFGMLLLWLFSAAPGTFASVGDPAPRQTEFNDRNYQPSRQINTSAPVRARPTKSRARTESKPRDIRNRTERVRWTNGRGELTEYQVYYEYDGTHVTFASVCSNHRKGSIDYRNCRKAAKQWFAGRCNNSSSSGRMYCHADNAFRP